MLSNILEILLMAGFGVCFWNIGRIDTKKKYENEIKTKDLEVKLYKSRLEDLVESIESKKLLMKVNNSMLEQKDIIIKELESSIELEKLIRKLQSNNIEKLQEEVKEYKRAEEEDEVEEDGE